MIVDARRTEAAEMMAARWWFSLDRNTQYAINTSWYTNAGV